MRMALEPGRSPPAIDAATAIPHVRRYLRFLGCDRAALDDLTQETMVAAARHWPNGAWPKPWLFTTARNALFLHWRSRGRNQEIADLDRLHGMWVEQAGEDGGAAKKAALRECVAGLPARSRLLLQLRYERSLPRDEIARQLGLGTEGVKSLLERVRAALAACVHRRLRDDRT